MQTSPFLYTYYPSSDGYEQQYYNNDKPNATSGVEFGGPMPQYFSCAPYQQQHFQLGWSPADNIPIEPNEVAAPYTSAEPSVSCAHLHIPSGEGDAGAA